MKAYNELEELETLIETPKETPIETPETPIEPL